MNLLFSRSFQVLYLLILSTAFFCSNIKAQQNKSQFFMGKIVSLSYSTPVTFAMVTNISTNKTAVSDSLGYFSILVSKGDSLTFSRIGFFEKEIKITDSILKMNKVHLIELQDRSYELNAVNFSLGTYDEFRHNVVHSELPSETPINPSLANKPGQKEIVLQSQARIRIGSPVTSVYNLMSKEGKSLRKLEKEEEKEREIASYKDKYSPEIVSNITGLKELELEKFMKYCNLNPTFLKNAIEYEIVERILDCFKAYKAEQANKETQAP